LKDSGEGHGKPPKLRLLKNTLALAAPNFLNPLISFILVLLISRYLGVGGLGKYSLILAYMGMFATLATLGLDALIIREVARRPDDAQLLFFNVSVFGTISAIVSAIAMNATVYLLDYDQEVLKAAFICSFALLFVTAIYYMNAVFTAFYKAKYTAFSYVTENAFRVLISAILVIFGKGVVAIFLVALCTRILGFAMMLYFYLTSIGWPKFEFRADIWRTLVREAPVFSSIVIFSTIHMSIDQIMLSKLQGVESVGIYSAADRLLALCKTLPIAFAMALLPSLTTGFDSGLGRMKRLTDSSIRYVLALSFPTIVGVIILSQQFIFLLYGPEFERSAALLRAHIISLAPFSTLFVLARVLTASDNQKIDMYINGFCALLNIVLNYLLIPVWAEMGAVVATLATVIVFNQLQYGYIRKQLFRVDFWNPGKRILPATLIMAAVTWALTPLNLFINIAVSAMVYMIALGLLGGLKKDEMDVIKRILPIKAGKR
jgi:O-antigen/teichoic acid export membrane protein